MPIRSFNLKPAYLNLEDKLVRYPRLNKKFQLLHSPTKSYYNTIILINFQTSIVFLPLQGIFETQLDNPDILRSFNLGSSKFNEVEVPTTIELLSLVFSILNES